MEVGRKNPLRKIDGALYGRSGGGTAVQGRKTERSASEGVPYRKVSRGEAFFG